MNKRTVFFLLFISILLLAFSVYSQEPSKDGELVAKSSIAQVTVYPDRATIVREASLFLNPSIKSIIFSGLPSTLIPNSLRATGRGAAAVKLLGLDVIPQYLESPLLPEIKKLQAEIDALTLEMGKIKGTIEVLDSQERFLMSIQSTTTAKASQEVAAGKPDILSWEKVFDFLGTKLGGVKQSRLDQQKSLEDQQVKLDALKKKLESMRPQRSLEGRKVSVIVEVGRAGEFKLDLSYTVVNARWIPVYMMRAVPDSSEIELATTAVIIQKSGENWENVKALLSTASPSLETQPSELSPWLLDIYVPRKIVALSSAERAKAEVVGGVIGGVVSDKEAPSAPSEAAIMREAEVATAAVLESGIHLNFEIKKNVDVPSDGSPHKVPIDSQTLKAKFDYTAVPKLQARTFLRGSFKNSLAYPLLPGSADLFILQDFVGSTRLPQISMDEEANLFFGEDDQIKVTHEQVKREKVAPGFLGKTEKLRLVYKITAQNLRKNPVMIDLLDQLPISQNSRIEIKDVKIAPEPTKKDEKGIMTWIFSLAPQEKKEILIDFTVEYPKDANIIGL